MVTWFQKLILGTYFQSCGSWLGAYFQSCGSLLDTFDSQTPGLNIYKYFMTNFLYVMFLYIYGQNWQQSVCNVKPSRYHVLCQKKGSWSKVGCYFEHLKWNLDDASNVVFLLMIVKVFIVIYSSYIYVSNKMTWWSSISVLFCINNWLYFSVGRQAGSTEVVLLFVDFNKTRWSIYNDFNCELPNKLRYQCYETS